MSENEQVKSTRLKLLANPANRIINPVGEVKRLSASNTTALNTYINPNNVAYQLGKLGVDSENNPPGPPAIPVTNGLIARYNASSFNVATQTWEDLVGSNDAPVSRGTVSVGTSSVGGDPVVYGLTGDGITWPAEILPSTFTIFHVTRYRDGTRGRIWQGQSNNWLDGFHGNKAGCAFHDGWIANSGTDVFGYSWVLSTSQNSLYRGEGTTYGTSGGSSSTRLTINHGLYSEYSDWEVAELVVFNRHLSSAEYISVEGWLASLYPNSTTVTPSVSGNYVGFQDTSNLPAEVEYITDSAYDLPINFTEIKRIKSEGLDQDNPIREGKLRLQVNSGTSEYNADNDDAFRREIRQSRAIVSDVSSGGGGGGGSGSSGPTQTWY